MTSKKISAHLPTQYTFRLFHEKALKIFSHRLFLGSLFFVLFTFLVFNQLSFFTRYPFDESGSVTRSAIGQIKIDTTLYLSEVISAKNRILWFQIIHKIYSTFPQLEPGYYNFFFGLFSSLFAIFGLTSLLRKGGASLLSALNWSVFGLIFFPFSYLSYGYHYKVAQGGTSTGLIAFGIMTFILGSSCPAPNATFKNQVRSPYSWRWILIFLLLFTVHPLNALFCIGLVFMGLLFSVFPFGALVRLGILGVVLAAITMKFYSVPLVKGQEEMLWNLIHLINGDGQVSGYFLPWKNGRVLIQEAGFWVGYYILLSLAKKENWFSPITIRYFRALFYTCFLFAFTHAVMYFFKNPRFLATDPSRVFAVLRPIGLVLLLQGIRVSILSLSPQCIIQFASAFSFPLVKAALFPLVTLLFGRFHRRFFSASLLILFSMALYTLKQDIPSSSLLYQGRVLFTVSCGLYLFFHFFLSKTKTIDERGFPKKEDSKLPLFRTAFVGAMAIIALASFMKTIALPRWNNSVERIQRRYANDQAFDELVNYIDKRFSNSSIIFTPIEKLLLGSEIRGTFAGFHTAGYGIYFGKLKMLNRELKTVWKIDLNDTKGLAQLNYDWSLKGGYSKYLEETFQKISVSDILRIKKEYPQFEAVVIPKGFELENEKDLLQKRILTKSYENLLFQVFTVSTAPQTG